MLTGRNYGIDFKDIYPLGIPLCPSLHTLFSPLQTIHLKIMWSFINKNPFVTKKVLSL